MTFNQVNAQFVTKNASNLIDTKFLCALRPSCEAVPAKMLRYLAVRGQFEPALIEKAML